MSGQMDAFSVSAGTLFVDAALMTNWIVEQIAPLNEQPDIVGGLKKWTQIGDASWNHDARYDQFDADDWKFLDDAWSGLPDVKGSRRDEWPIFKAAFEAAKVSAGKRAPVWDVRAQFLSPRRESEMLRAKVRTDHFTQIDQQLLSGELKGITSSRVAATRFEPGVKVSIDGARTYLARAGYGLVEAGVEIRSPATPPASAPQAQGTVHSTKTAVRNVLDPVIDLAQKQVRDQGGDPFDTAAVWVKMQALAEMEHPPLLAATPNGLKYTNNGQSTYLTMDALDKRLKRRRPPP